MTVVAKSVVVGERPPAPTEERVYWRCDNPDCGKEAEAYTATAGWFVAYEQPTGDTPARREWHHDTAACAAATFGKVG